MFILIPSISTRKSYTLALDITPESYIPIRSLLYLNFPNLIKNMLYYCLTRIGPLNETKHIAVIYVCLSVKNIFIFALVLNRPILP